MISTRLQVLTKEAIVVVSDSIHYDIYMKVLMLCFAAFRCEEKHSSFPKFVRKSVITTIPVTGHSSEVLGREESCDCEHVTKAIGGKTAELGPRLVKAKSEDELLSSNYRLYCHSHSSSSLGAAMAASPAARQIGQLRWNSEVDLVSLYGEYSDAYAEVLADIRDGNNYANLRKVSSLV